MNKFEIVYTNNNVLGYFDGDTYKSYDTENKNNLLETIKNKVISKDFNRKTSSLIIGLTLLIGAITLALLMILNVLSLGKGQWITYTFICAGLVFVWIVLYFLLGLIFYRKLVLNFHFKSSKINNPNSCVTYASSNYCKFINNYSKYIANTSFVESTTNKKPNLVLFGLKKPAGYSSFIFNGNVTTNIPYFYITIKNQKFLFLPGFIIIVNGKKSDVIATCDFSIKKNEKTYHLYKNDMLITSFVDNGDFNINFFNFKYDQIA